ncbi:MAG TPA: ribosome-associated translation inhibitor RaiA [bacterium]|nr:ribosome-associated translation inhibitor RaiA [bacterium]
MKIIITSRHEKLTEALRASVEDKIKRVERYLGKIKEAHVVLNFEKKGHTCEINLTAKGLKMSSKAVSRDMYNSIDGALEKLETQAKKHKEIRVERHHGRVSPFKSVTHGLIPPPQEGEGIEVIQSRKYSVKPMAVEEAALQLAKSKDEFMVFFDAETGRTGVVYKRKDHHIGLIEPEY